MPRMATATAPETGRLLRRREAADYLGVGYSKFHELVRRGEFGCVEIPSAGGVRPGKRYPQAELDAFIERHRSPAAAS